MRFSQHRLDRRVRPFQLHRQFGYFRGDVVDALAQQCILHALGRPGAFRLLLDRIHLALQLGAFIARKTELFLDRGFLKAPLLTVYGGKLTTYRRLAEDVLARLARYLGRSQPWTARTPA